MYGILVKNTGMWGYSTWVKHNGEIMKFETKEEAQKVADEFNAQMSTVDNFNQYFASKMD